MRLSLSMKVGLVSLFSCLALLLGLLSSTGLASAHTATTLQSARISAMVLADDQRRGNVEQEGITDPSSDSPTTGCPAGTVSAVMRDQQGNALHAICIDTAGDPPLFDIPDWNTSQDRPKD
jgi:hypothetical protein